MKITAMALKLGQTRVFISPMSSKITEKREKREKPLWGEFIKVLYCIVLYCIVLYCIVLYCIVLYCIVL